MNSIENQLNDIFNLNAEFTHIYISFGSKFNEHDVYFDGYPNQSIFTNSTYQQNPMFIRSKDTSTYILSIIIDKFPNEIELDTHLHNINNTIVQNYPNLRCCTIDHLCTTQSINIIIPIILNKIHNRNIIPKNCMFCSYIKHRNNPNTQELCAETTISYNIQNILDSSYEHKYEFCMYEWFGYNYKLYNFIYNYKKAKTIYMFHPSINRIHNIIDRYMDQYYVIDDITIIKPYTLHRILSCIYCFTHSYYDNEPGLVTPILDKFNVHNMPI
jgi:hypothetical protein